jgi:formylglycine-generating enzyme required for sulfatase activity
MATRASRKIYQDFVIAIERVGEGHFRVEASGPTGEATTAFALPFDDKDIEIFMLKVGHPRRMTTRGRVPEPVQPTVAFGASLFNAVVNGDVRDLFVSARHDAARGDYGLRLQLRLAHAPELASLPWEYLYDGRDFLALSEMTPVVRYLDLQDRPRPMKVTPPLRILVTISAPHDQPRLNMETERARVREALASLTASGLTDLDFAPDATLSTLRRALHRARSLGCPYHVWHYVGHGTYDEAQNASVLAFCDPANLSYPVGGFQLGTLFSSYPQIRLVLLNACEGARPDPQDPFAGVAAALVERGVPAVIGMQFEISDEAASALAEGFYQALADGLPVDAAVTEARQAVFFLPNWIEWATPVLFMRAPDGQIFDIAAASRPIEILDGVVSGERGYDDATSELEAAHRREMLADLYAEARRLHQAQKVREAAELVEGIEALDPDYPDPEGLFDAVKRGREPADLYGPDRLAITSPIHLELVCVPAGEFLMGSHPARDEHALDNEQPQHRVAVAEFSIGKYPVTNAQYAAFARAVGQEAPDQRGKEDHPVVNVSWRRAVAFCEWLSRETGRPFRLPTEAEWEKAARGVDGRIYPWGDEWDPHKCNSPESGIGGTSPVGRFSPAGDSPCGAADMAGNVWEWCGSVYRPYPYRAEDGREDPDAKGYRVLRGGSFDLGRYCTRCACRYDLRPVFFDTYGFRVVVSPALRS